jgi:hypothetical protein
VKGTIYEGALEILQRQQLWGIWRAGKHYIIAANLGDNDTRWVAREFVSKEGFESALRGHLALLWMQRKVSKEIHPRSITNV